MSLLPAAIGLVGLSIVAFVASIRIGILLGRGLDRAIESRRVGETEADTEVEEPQHGGSSGE